MNDNSIKTASVEPAKHNVPIYSGYFEAIIQYIEISELKTDRCARIGAECVRSFRSSIEERGFLRPVFIDADMNVTDGQKRVAAARAAGYMRVPCVFAPSPLVFEDDLLICKLIREAPHFFLFADILSRLKSEYMYSQEAIAGALGKSQSFVANKLRLLKFSQDEREMVKRAGLTERHCRALLSIRDDAARRRALDIACADELSVAATEELVASIPRKHEGSRLKSFEHELQRLARKYAVDGAPIELSDKRNGSLAVFTLKIRE